MRELRSGIPLNLTDRAPDGEVALRETPPGVASWRSIASFDLVPLHE
jgi:hypothetical protein